MSSVTGNLMHNSVDFLTVRVWECRKNLDFCEFHFEQDKNWKKKDQKSRFSEWSQKSREINCKILNDWKNIQLLTEIFKKRPVFVEIKKKIDYDKDYVTIKRFKGKYDPIEDCNGVYGLSEIVDCAENPDEADFSDFSDYVEYLEEFDMEFTQLVLERKVYVKSHWHRDVYFKE